MRLSAVMDNSKMGPFINFFIFKKFVNFYSQIVKIYPMRT